MKFQVALVSRLRVAVFYNVIVTVINRGALIFQAALRP